MVLNPDWVQLTEHLHISAPPPSEGAGGSKKGDSRIS
jgi:hypothetical protein